jgi:hypothetical protein
MASKNTRKTETKMEMAKKKEGMKKGKKPMPFKKKK